MKLIEAGSEDLDALVERWFALATAMEPYDDLNELVYTAVEDVPDDAFRAHLSDEKISDYLIVQESETIGFVTLQEGHHPSREYSQYLRIVNLAIDEPYRNQGYGTAVVEYVKDLAHDQGCDHLKVSCEWHNDAARQFFRELGLRPKQVDYAHPLE